MLLGERQRERASKVALLLRMRCRRYARTAACTPSYNFRQLGLHKAAAPALAQTSLKLMRWKFSAAHAFPTDAS
eukprot:1079724-Pleurochrysis_carterae.AAC.1